MMSWLTATTGFELQWPWLLLLLPLPWLVLYRRTLAMPSFIAPQLPIFETVKALGFGKGLHSQHPARWKKAMLLLIWLSLVLAACRPTYIGEQIDIPLTGRDLMLAIDISPSMKETDMVLEGNPKDRLEIVKHIVSQFVVERAGDRIGLILFGSQPYVQSPLTFDVVTVNTLLQEAYLGMAGQATAIGDAIALGVKRLRQRSEQSRVLILMSDGANTAGDIPPEKAAQLAAQEKIKIYTVGIGADEMLKRSFFGAQRINPSADLDEAMLTQIAELTQGQYFRARNTEELKSIYEAINSLEPVAQESKSFRPTTALYFWFLALSLVSYGTLVLHTALAKLVRSANRLSGGESQ